MDRCRKPNRSWLAALASFSLLPLCLSGCSFSQWVHNGFKVGPNYCEPPAEVAEQWIDADDQRVIPAPPAFPDWWSVFQDPVLNELIGTAYRQNLSLREAGLRIQEAMAIRAVATGNLLPQAQTINGSYARDQISTLGQPRVTPLPSFSRSFDAWALSGNLSWELDFWGRFRRAIEAADANLEASVNDYDAMLVCLITEVVTAYVDIQTFEERLVYARNNVKIQEGSLDLAQERFDAGKTDRISVRLSKSNVEATRAAIPSLEIGRRQAMNRLCVLLGIPPNDLTQIIEFREGIPDVPPEVALGIPADLLRRRPDVRAAERRVAAQSAEIGIALTDLYPRVAVTGSISVSAEHFSDLGKPLSQGGSIGPGFQWNVLNYGRIVNNARAQDARFLQLVASYQNTVLLANQEVEDALVSFLENQKRVKALAISAGETKEALELAMIRFREGEDDFTGVFILQGDLAERQDEAATAQGNVVLSLANVYKALGGGWEIRCAESLLTVCQDSSIDTPHVEPIPGPITDPASSSASDPPTSTSTPVAADEGPLLGQKHQDITRLPPGP